MFIEGVKHTIIAEMNKVLMFVYLQDEVSMNELLGSSELFLEALTICLLILDPR